MNKASKHVVIDGRSRQSGTGRVIERFLQIIPSIDSVNHYTVLLEPGDKVEYSATNISTTICKYKRFSMNPLEQIGIAWQLYRLRPDLVFFTQTGITPLLYFGKNVTITHDLTMLRFVRAKKIPMWLHKLRMAGYHLLFWKGNKFANIIFTPTKFVKKDLAKYMPSAENKIVVTYEAGSEPIKLSPKPLKGLDKPFLLHVGSPLPHKNVYNLVKAFELLKKDYPKLKLVLAGKVEYYFEELIDWMKDREYTSDIIISGFISDEELKWLYTNAEAYVWPSLSEGFGLPGLEAMANGCPVVSSNATCMPEVYGDAAEYFDPNDVENMRKSISNVISSDKLRNNMIKKGLSQVKKYSWDNMTKQMYDEYSKLL